MADTRTKVFISYSRKDRAFVSRLAEALEARGTIEVFRDTEDILPTEEWRGRLEQLIGAADTIVFAMSPHALASEVCAWEVEYAANLNKRLAPVVIEEVEPETIPAVLARHNYIFFTGRDDFDKALGSLVTALGTDIDWIREHTRLGDLARRWEANRQERALLLRGNDLTVAERWRHQRPPEAPEPTDLHIRYIARSRSARRRRILVVTAVSTVLGLIGLLVVFITLIAVEVLPSDEIFLGFELSAEKKDWLYQNKVIERRARIKVYYKRPYGANIETVVTDRRITVFTRTGGKPVIHQSFELGEVETVIKLGTERKTADFVVYGLETKDKKRIILRLPDTSDRTPHFIDMIREGMR